MTWIDRARSRIAKLDAELPADATIAQRRRMLRDNSSSFHGGTSWGKKVWARAGREYLSRFIKSIDAVPEKHLSPLERLMRSSGK
jgi:hypothetical protein